MKPDVWQKLKTVEPIYQNSTNQNNKKIGTPIKKLD